MRRSNLPLYMDDARPRSIWTTAANYFHGPCEICPRRALKRAVEKLEYINDHCGAISRWFHSLPAPRSRHLIPSEVFVFVRMPRAQRLIHSYAPPHSLAPSLSPPLTPHRPARNKSPRRLTRLHSHQKPRASASTAPPAPISPGPAAATTRAATIKPTSPPHIRSWPGAKIASISRAPTTAPVDGTNVATGDFHGKIAANGTHLDNAMYDWKVGANPARPLSRSPGAANFPRHPQRHRPRPPPRKKLRRPLPRPQRNLPQTQTRPPPATTLPTANSKTRQLKIPSPQTSPPPKTIRRRPLPRGPPSRPSPAPTSTASGRSM